MTELENILFRMIDEEGAVPVSRFMQLALTHPQHGYYIKGDPLGVAGDFTTAPEISQIFGELIGIWVADTWKRMGSPESFVLLELGPGRGTLMQDALRATAHVSGFHEAMCLCLVETNQTLKEAQLQKLSSYHPQYHEGVSSLPSLPLIVIANEFFDALPVHQYVNVDGVWRERMIGLADEKLTYLVSPMPCELPLGPEGRFYELCPDGLMLIKDLAQHISKFGGAGLVIDYGYYEPCDVDTLQAVSGHKPVSPLQNVGHIDLTCHVDFLALRKAAERAGVSVSPTISQAEYLEAMGIELRAWQLKLNAGYDQAMDIEAGVKRLINPMQMGTLFKVMSFCSHNLKSTAGFP